MLRILASAPMALSYHHSPPSLECWPFPLEISELNNMAYCKRSSYYELNSTFKVIGRCVHFVFLSVLRLSLKSEHYFLSFYCIFFICFKISLCYMSLKGSSHLLSTLPDAFGLLKTPLTARPESSGLKMRALMGLLPTLFTSRPSSPSRVREQVWCWGWNTQSSNSQHCHLREQNSIFWIYVRWLRYRKKNLFRNFYHYLIHFLSLENQPVYVVALSVK